MIGQAWNVCNANRIRAWDWPSHSNAFKGTIRHQTLSPMPTLIATGLLTGLLMGICKRLNLLASAAIASDRTARSGQRSQDAGRGPKSVVDSW